MLWVFSISLQAMNWGIGKFLMHLSVRTPSLTVPLHTEPLLAPQGLHGRTQALVQPTVCWQNPSSPSASLLILPHPRQQLCSMLPLWCVFWGELVSAYSPNVKVGVSAQAPKVFSPTFLLSPLSVWAGLVLICYFIRSCTPLSWYLFCWNCFLTHLSAYHSTPNTEFLRSRDYGTKHASCFWI